jgi:hypothetical protein
MFRIFEHLKTYPEDMELQVRIAGEAVKLDPQWYPDDGYVRLGPSYPMLQR